MSIGNVLNLQVIFPSINYWFLLFFGGNNEKKKITSKLVSRIRITAASTVKVQPQKITQKNSQPRRVNTVPNLLWHLRTTQWTSYPWKHGKTEPWNQPRGTTGLRDSLSSSVSPVLPTIARATNPHTLYLLDWRERERKPFDSYCKDSSLCGVKCKETYQSYYYYF